MFVWCGRRTDLCKTVSPPSILVRKCLPQVTIDALPCPTAPREVVSLRINFPIPFLAKGMGAFNVTMSGADNSGARVAFCIDVVVSV